MDFVNMVVDSIAGRFGSGLAVFVGAALLGLLGWIIARMIRAGLKTLLRRTEIDNRLSKAVGRENTAVSVEDALANLVYYLLLLAVIVLVLDRLGLNTITQPLNDMLRGVASFVPNILAAGIIGFVGFMLANILRQIVGNIAAGLGANRLGERVGLTTPLSSLLATIAYAFLLIPVGIMALDALNIDAISGPATAMLQRLLTAIPAILGAAIVLAIAYFVARIVSGIVVDVLNGIGTNELVARVGLGDMVIGGRRPTQLLGWLVMIYIMLFAATEAAELLGFTALTDILSSFIGFGSQVLLGLVVFAIGFYLANLAYNFVRASSVTNSGTLATLTRAAIVIFTTTLALKQIGIGDEIVNLAFGLTLGAVAVAAALAFGLGSREIAGREVERMLSVVRDNSPSVTDGLGD